MKSQHTRRLITSVMLVSTAALGYLGTGGQATASSPPETSQVNDVIVTTKVVVKDLSPNGRRVLSKHVYQTTSNSRTAKSSGEEDGNVSPSNSGRRWVKIQSNATDTFGLQLWHQGVRLDWSWTYPQSVRINDQSKYWVQDDRTASWNGWLEASSDNYGWAGGLYPNSGWAKKAQGSWSIWCLNGWSCHQYPWDKLWAHSDGTYHYAYNYYHDTPTGS